MTSWKVFFEWVTHVSMEDIQQWSAEEREVMKGAISAILEAIQAIEKEH